MITTVDARPRLANSGLLTLRFVKVRCTLTHRLHAVAWTPFIAFLGIALGFPLGFALALTVVFAFVGTLCPRAFVAALPAFLPRVTELRFSWSPASQDLRLADSVDLAAFDRLSTTAPAWIEDLRRT